MRARRAATTGGPCGHRRPASRPAGRDWRPPRRRRRMPATPRVPNFSTAGAPGRNAAARPSAKRGLPHGGGPPAG
eukprot:11005960-Lingulodinium_polyedra.AAC.1